VNINIYYEKENWQQDNPNEVLEGDAKVLDNVLFIDTIEDGRSYRQILSFNKLFAVTYKMPYGFLTMEKDIFIYLTNKSWSESKPEFELKGAICDNELSSEYISFITADGFKQFISKSAVFAMVYER
jgi:hypothetical protein